MTDLQISTPQTFSFHIYPTAEGYQLVPTDFPHKLTKRLLLFLLFSAGGVAGFGLNTQLFFMWFSRENFLVLHQYTVSIYKQREMKLQKIAFKLILLE